MAVLNLFLSLLENDMAADLGLFRVNVLFSCPRDDSQGALRFAPVCPSVCPFVMLYGREFV